MCFSGSIQVTSNTTGSAFFSELQNAIRKKNKTVAAQG
jgi:hypothetical protein